MDYDLQNLSKTRFPKFSEIRYVYSKESSALKFFYTSSCFVWGVFFFFLTFTPLGVIHAISYIVGTNASTLS